MLETLQSQREVDWAEIEILIVNNNSNDDTFDVIAKFRPKCSLQPLFETNQGLSHARNLAVKHARGDWILFTDDDVDLDPYWLKGYWLAFNAFPNVEFAGGRILPKWSGHQPKWFKGRRVGLLDGLLVWYDLGGEDRPYVKQDPEPFGASFGFRKEVAKRIGDFRTDLGVNGSNMGRGEETDFIRRAKSAGAEGVYVQTAICWHIAEPERFTVRALFEHGKAKASEILSTNEAGHPSSNRMAVISYILRGMLQLLRGNGDRFRECIINAGVQHGLTVAQSEKRARCVAKCKSG